MKAFLKEEQIQLPYREAYRKKIIIGKIIISNSNKMQPLLIASKAWQAVPWFLKKRVLTRTKKQTKTN